MARVNRTTGFFLVLGMIVLAATVTGARLLNPSSSNESNPTTVDRSDEPVNTWGGGKLDVPSRVSNPSPGTPGIVSSIEVQENELLKAGQVMLRLDDSLAQAELKKVKSELELAKLGVDQATLQLNEYYAKVKLLERAVTGARLIKDEAVQQLRIAERTKQALGSKAEEEIKIAALGVEVATEQYLAKKDELAALSANVPTVLVRAAERKAQALQEQVREAEKSLDKYVVKAPKDGRVFRFNVSVGDPIGGPTPNMQPAIWFCPNEPLIVRAEIDQEHAGKIQAGMPVTLFLHGSKGGENWPGKVASVSNWITRRRSQLMEPDQVNDARTCECIIRFDDPPADQKIGTQFRVEIHTAGQWAAK